MKLLFISILSVCACFLSFAQVSIDRDKVLDKRLDKINFYHIGTGLEIAGNHNYMLSPKVYLGFGSPRNLLNVDIGLKLSFNNPVRSANSEYIRFYSMPFFLSGSINAVKWKQNAIYVGAEVAYNIALGSGYHSSNHTAEDNAGSVAKSHASWQGKMGYRYKNWDLSFFYEDDLSPAIDQKKVYESAEYDYDMLHESIFERWRLGMSITYNFRF